MSRRRAFRHQVGFVINETTLLGISGIHNNRIAVGQFEDMKNYELHNRPNPENRINNAHHRTFGATAFATNLGPYGTMDSDHVGVSREISPEPSQLNVGSMSTDTSRGLSPSPESSPNPSVLNSPSSTPSPGPVVSGNSAEPVVLANSISEHFERINAIIDSRHNLFVLTPTNDGGVMDIQRLLDVEILSTRERLDRYLLQEQKIKDDIDERADELMNKIPLRYVLPVAWNNPRCRAGR